MHPAMTRRLLIAASALSLCCALASGQGTASYLAAPIYAQWAVADALSANGVAALTPGRSIIFW
jgi:hypothetical protein